jgi:hypothetical protein
MHGRRTAALFGVLCVCLLAACDSSDMNGGNVTASGAGGHGGGAAGQAGGGPTGGAGGVV